MTKPHMNHHLSQEEGATKSIAIIAIVAAIVIGALSFSPSHTASAEKDFSKCFGEHGTNNCPKQQSKAYERCTEEASEDGVLTTEEQLACGHSIYG